MKLYRGARPYQILKYLAIGSGVLLVSALSPKAGAQLITAGVKSYFRKRGFEKYQLLSDLKKLQKRELIDFKELKNGVIEIKITKAGKEVALSYKIDEIKLKIPENWDRKWRLIMFDIPHSLKRARDAFRKKLNDLNFYAVQKSVFITPYPCEDEIDFLASFYNIRNFILIFYIDRFEGEEKIKHYFKL